MEPNEPIKKEVRIELDFLPISVNMAYCFSRRNKKMYKTKKHRERQEQWGGCLKSYANQKVYGLVEIEYHFTKKRRNKYDLDNLIKFAQDQLMRCDVIEDDSNVVKIIATKQFGPSDKTVMIIRQYNP
jgi:Holliday junction resolvase RusA-like endonuclease